MKIKAISIWQPRASLIAVGAIKYETRSWWTNYRGPLLICAALTKVVEENYLQYSQEFRDAVYSALHKESDGYIPWMVPYGKAVAIVNLSYCYRTEDFVHNPEAYPLSEEEKTLGDFSPGRYAWKLENVRAITPFPVKGRQRLFEIEVPDELICPTT